MLKRPTTLYVINKNDRQLQPIRRRRNTCGSMTKITYSIRQENSVSGWWRSSCDLSNIVNESTKQGIITAIIMLLVVLLSICTRLFSLILLLLNQW
jgi:hypothetical protein